MADEWFAKVEYTFDKTESIVECCWIHEFEPPTFDPHVVYRCFWSPIEEESPTSMLKRVPDIPFLSELEEKAGKAGYYRACILAVHDSIDKFEESRSRKQTTRGSKNGSGKKSGKQGKDKDESLKPSKSESAKAKSSASRSNLSRQARGNTFQNLDRDVRTEQGEEFDSDDSDADESLVSLKHLNVLQISVKNLKAKLLEKCKIVEELEKKLDERDAELEKLRMLNRGLQETVLEKVTSMLSSPRHRSVPPSRSSSISSLSSLYEKSSCPRSRTVSSSSVASAPPLSYSPCSSPVLNHKRKTPPSSPSSPSDTSKSSKSANLNSSKGDSLPASPSRPSLGDTTLVNSESEAALDDVFVPQESEQHEDPDKVRFCEGFMVSKSQLDAVLAKPLGKANDGTFVKELAVVVFGHKCLYNSSISERKLGKSGETDKVARKKLDKTAVAEIQDRLYKRVLSEFKDAPPASQLDRFKISTVNRFIYDKIKKMRQNINLAHLAE